MVLSNAQHRCPWHEIIKFDSYSQKLTNTITESDTEEDIALLLAETMDKAFGNEVRPDKFLDTARKIRKALFEDSHRS